MIRKFYSSPQVPRSSHKSLMKPPTTLQFCHKCATYEIFKKKSTWGTLVEIGYIVIFFLRGQYLKCFDILFSTLS